MQHHPYFVNLPRGTDMAQVRHALGAEARVHAQPAAKGRRQWLDSHDWRVHNSGQLLERWGSTGNMRLRLSPYDDPDQVIELPSGEQPTFAATLPSAVLRRRLDGVLGERSLMLRCEVLGTVQVLNVTDQREKIIVRVEVWRPRLRGELFVRVTPLRGYAAAAQRAAKRLRGCAGAHRDEPDPLLVAAQKLDITPGNYPSWHLPALAGDARADDALLRLLAHYAQIMDLNVAGMRTGLDLEFLHQFRIGLRRSRALLRHAPGVLAGARLRPFVEHLACLAAQTGIVRDADVRAIAFPRYAAMLGPSVHEALTPVMACLELEREHAHRQLAGLIGSHRFRSRWLAWMRFVHTQAPRHSRQPGGPQPLASVAPDFIATSAKKVVRRGRLIDHRSLPSALHDLRKSCKNLRYLIDVYEFCVPKKTLKQAVNRLKDLQDLLGEYQDLDVHQATLRDLQQRFAQQGSVAVDTHHAMDLLHGTLQARAQRVRTQFPQAFASFRKIHLARAVRKAAQ